MGAPLCAGSTRALAQPRWHAGKASEGATRNYLAGLGLVRSRNQPDESLHQLRTAVHHHPQNQERAINMSILTMSGPDKFPHRQV